MNEEGWIFTKPMNYKDNKEPMTIDVIKRRVDLIKQQKDDPEGAHEMEDELYKDVLKEIASWGMFNEYDTCAKIAVEALKAAEIDFDRWYS